MSKNINTGVPSTLDGILKAQNDHVLSLGEAAAEFAKGREMRDPKQFVQEQQPTE